VADESSGGGGDDVPAGGDGQAPFGLCYFISISLDCFCYSSSTQKITRIYYIYYWHFSFFTV
jgi:hypothetical protein